VAFSHPEAKQWDSPSAWAQQTELREAPAFGPLGAEQELERESAAGESAAPGELEASEQVLPLVEDVKLALRAAVAAEQWESEPVAVLQAQVSVAPWAPFPLQPVSFRFLEQAAEELAALSALPSRESQPVQHQPFPSQVLSRQLLPRAAQQLQQPRCGVSFGEYPPTGPRRCSSATSQAHPYAAAHE